jgi:hypothetical protein
MCCTLASVYLLSENVMFLKIDEWLIARANWVVRQCELYTSITRRTLFSGILSVFMLAVVAYCVMAAMYLIVSNGEMWFLECMICFGLIGIYKKYVTDKRNMSDTATSLPAEILTRRYARYTLLFYAVLIFSLEFLFMIGSLIAVPESNKDFAYEIWSNTNILYILCYVLTLAGIFFVYALYSTRRKSAPYLRARTQVVRGSIVVLNHPRYRVVFICGQFFLTLQRRLLIRFAHKYLLSHLTRFCFGISKIIVPIHLAKKLSVGDSFS